MEKKNIKESVLAMVLVAYALLAPIFTALDLGKNDTGKSTLSLTVTMGIMTGAGLIGATILYARRFLDDSSKKLIIIAALAETVILSVVGIIATPKKIVYIIVSAVVVAAFIWVCNSKFKYIEDCEPIKFWITVIALYLIFPSLAVMVSEIIMVILGLIIVVAMFVLGMGMITAGPVAPTMPQFKDVYVDAKGKEHDTAYGAQVANEKYANED